MAAMGVCNGSWDGCLHLRLRVFEGGPFQCVLSNQLGVLALALLADSSARPLLPGHRRLPVSASRKEATPGLQLPCYGHSVDDVPPIQVCRHFCCRWLRRRSPWYRRRNDPWPPLRRNGYATSGERGILCVHDILDGPIRRGAVLSHRGLWVAVACCVWGRGAHQRPDRPARSLLRHQEVQKTFSAHFHIGVHYYSCRGAYDRQ
mmetsp:Transcript_21778/g.49254  ORF Transcript_21778/g.49254 Transcript_21778/m.49254 type:complete len:204 (+) Transcript_21778:611-1222(+)